jgi:hypothetical protein
MHVLSLLREMSLDPASDDARPAVRLVRDRVTWQGCGPPEADGNPFFAGEVEPCINGQVGAVGAYFGRRLFRRKSTSGVIGRDRKGGAAWTRFAFPTWWHYDVLRGLEHLRRAGVAPDERVAEAVDLVVSKRNDNDKWLLDTQYVGKMPIETNEGEGRPSRWITLRALRVFEWYSGRGPRS